VETTRQYLDRIEPLIAKAIGVRAVVKPPSLFVKRKGRWKVNACVICGAIGKWNVVNRHHPLPRQVQPKRNDFTVWLCTAQCHRIIHTLSNWTLAGMPWSEQERFILEHIPMTESWPEHPLERLTF